MFTVTFIVFLSVFYLSQTYQIKNDIEKQASQVVTRVALDINTLPIADPFFSYSGNTAVVESYVNKINKVLEKQAARIQLLNISIEQANSHDNILVQKLVDAHRDVYVSFIIQEQHLKSAYIVPLILALLNTAFYSWVNNAVARTRASRPEQKEKVEQPKKLVIDLYTKTIMLNSRKQDAVKLANKPLCFYLALVEYCESHPDVVLNQNKDVPDELIDIADKYFHRLITLGHTIRKRPNFSSSLEKTLSEIRAALDDIMAEHAELKTKYYPPKAHGEGSRSKIHSYGLANIGLIDIELIGK
ncbi:hypothetical protein PCIT_b0545 [Pseudoalteromonas citrea]|uniref:Uncharacterized protein n=2 Tax=Pseudoalteromonas citrea TaxID=43655 RepID=A0AAD4FQ00_9GAMM|nr:hypothetical protein PCIT_b0545 [Pseudoalteromonas citrea]